MAQTWNFLFVVVNFKGHKLLLKFILATSKIFLGADKKKILFLKRPR